MTFSALKKIVGIQLTGCRLYARTRPKPWMATEVTESILETASTPPPPLAPAPKAKRTFEANPAKHTLDDVGKFYTIPEDQEYLFRLCIRNTHREIIESFNEMSFMIRKPSLEVIDYLKRADYSKPAIRYLLYGEDQAGKTTTQFHLLHYAASQNFIIIHVPEPSYWFYDRKKECSISESRPPLVDIPLDGAVLLKNFEIQNKEALQNPELVTSRDYVWNNRETTPAGSPLAGLVAHGISRVKYSCDCFDGIVNELKLLATQGKCKVLVVVNAFNSLYMDKTKLKINDKRDVAIERVSLVQTIFNAIKPDWSNGAAVLSISPRFCNSDHRDSYLPLYLLGKKGIEDIDPFIPVEVPPLTEQEFHNLLDYYEEKRWIQRIGGREEVEFLTSRLPGEIMLFCKHL